MGILKQHQEPITIDEQVENLQNLGLIIDDEEYAKRILKRVSYYRLIKAYSITLKENGSYKEGVCFEDIVDLYEFNAEFRNILFKLLEHIEVSLRACIGNYFSIKYGNFAYRDVCNFDREEYQEKVIERIDKEVERSSKTAFIKHFRLNYQDGDIPFYVAVEVTTFGTLSMMYKNMKLEDKKTIAKEFGEGVSHYQFASWIENFAFVRNECAHYGRLYNAKINKTPKLLNKYKNMGIKNNRIFITLLNLKMVSDECVYTNFYKELCELIELHPKVELNKMGFPDNWKDLLNS